MGKHFELKKIIIVTSLLLLKTNVKKGSLQSAKKGLVQRLVEVGPHSELYLPIYITILDTIILLRVTTGPPKSKKT